MVAMVQRLDASGFFFRTLLSVSSLLALVLKVFRNRFRCHGQSVAELHSFNLSNFVHSLKFIDCLEEMAFLKELVSQYLDELARLSSFPVSPRVCAQPRSFQNGGGRKGLPVPKPFRRISPNAKSDAALAPACWTSDTWTDVSPRPA